MPLAGGGRSLEPRPPPQPLRRRFRNWAAGLGATSGGVGLLAWLTDWRVIAAMGLLVLVMAVAFVAFMGPARVREWIARQVRKASGEHASGQAGRC